MLAEPSRERGNASANQRQIYKLPVLEITRQSRAACLCLFGTAALTLFRRYPLPDSDVGDRTERSPLRGKIPLVDWPLSAH